MKVHLGILFNVIDKSGNVSENGKIYKFTQLQFCPSGICGAKPLDDDDNGMIDLL